MRKQVETEAGATASPRWSPRVRIPVLLLLGLAAVWILSFILAGPGRSDWAYEMVELDLARERGFTGRGVRVGIVDSGVALDHPALSGVAVTAFRDFVDGRAEPYDDVGHGTGMAGIICGHPPLAGGAVDVELIVAKVLDRKGKCTDERVAEAIRFCMDPNGDGDGRDGVDVISLSLGWKSEAIALFLGTDARAAVDAAARAGILVVAAAGNDGARVGSRMLSPGAYPTVIAVGAVDLEGSVAPFSTPGSFNFLRLPPHEKPEVLAPGVRVVTADADGGRARCSGTSYATAFVSAGLAVALSAVPDFGRRGSRGGTLEAATTVKRALQRSCRPVPGQRRPHDEKAGYGILRTIALIEELRRR